MDREDAAEGVRSRPIARGRPIVNVHREAREGFSSPRRKVALFTGDGGPCRPLE